MCLAHGQSGEVNTQKGKGIYLANCKTASMLGTWI